MSNQFLAADKSITVRVLKTLYAGCTPYVYPKGKYQNEPDFIREAIREKQDRELKKACKC